MSQEWLTLSEAATLLGVHPNTVRNWADQGQIPVHRTQGGHRRFNRSEVELWQHCQEDPATPNAQSVVQNALKHTRFQIAEGKLEAEAWYNKLDDEARTQYRQSGRNLMHGLIAYLSAEDNAASAEARSLGYEYASRGRRCHLSVLDATQAFLFFRNSLLEAMLSAYESAAVNSPHAWSGMFRKVSAFTDQIMLTLLETYAAFERNTR